MTDLTIPNDTMWSTAATIRMGVPLVLCFALAALAGASGILAAGPGAPPGPVLPTAFGPIAAFVALYHGSTTFREFVLGRDRRFASMLQAW